MIENILTQIHPNDRAVAAAALSLYLVKRSEGWSISNCVSQVNPDTQLWVDATLEPLEDAIDLIPGLVAELLKPVKESGDRQWWAVIGYANGRIEVMDGDDYKKNPVSLNLYSDDPNDPVWVHAVDRDRDNCPNEATAVFKAALGSAPAGAISELLQIHLNDEDWELNQYGCTLKPEQAEEIDRFLVECGETSVFEGITRIESEDSIEWINEG